MANEDHPPVPPAPWLFKLRRLLHFVALLAIALRVCGEDTQQVGYRASGELRFQQVGTNGVIRYEQTWPFTLIENEVGKWRLEISTTIQYMDLPLNTTNIISCDGTNIYSVTYSPDIVETPLNAKPKVVPNTKEAYSAVISAGRYPIDSGSAVGQIWLAFMGGNYLNPNKTQMRFPNLLVPDPRTDPWAWDCDLKYSWTRSGGRWLINSAEYIIRKSYIRNNAVDYPEMDEPVSTEQRDEFRRKFARYKNLKTESTLTSDYYLDETTNVNGRLFPMRFHSNLGLEETHSFTDRFVGVVSSVVIIVATNLMPPLNGEIYVEDRRLRYKDQLNFRGSVRYKLPENVWPTSTDDPLIQRLALQRPPQGFLEISSQSRKYYAVEIIIGITLSLPFLFLFVKRLRTNRGKK
jgi:hypothetical protein